MYSLILLLADGSLKTHQVENRVCVALSRARLGFYIFGNAQMITKADRIWWEIGKILNLPPSRIGFAMPIVCQRHGKLEYIKGLCSLFHWPLFALILRNDSPRMQKAMTGLTLLVAVTNGAKRLCHATIHATLDAIRK
jgi:hypothetical protein